MNRQRVAVDVGNSSIKFAVAGDNSIRIQRVSLSSDAWLAQLASTVQSLRADRLAVDWVIASVNQPASSQLTDWIVKTHSDDHSTRISHQDVGLAIDVEHPAKTGIDRILAARGAYLRSGQRASICIDAGTAITVDLIDASGTFRGGAIMPGIGLQLESLHRATDALPKLEIPPELSCTTYPARSTGPAILSGVSAATAGGIRELMGQARRDCDVECVYVTGGDANSIAAMLDCPHEVVPDLPLRTLFELPLPVRGDQHE